MRYTGEENDEPPNLLRDMPVDDEAFDDYFDRELFTTVYDAAASIRRQLFPGDHPPDETSADFIKYVTII